MGSVTNLLLVVLIGLIGWIGKIFYEKMEKFGQAIQDILLSDVDMKKDIERNTDDIKDHEVRITTLEKTKA
jgi:hypothetical protein